MATTDEQTHDQIHEQILEAISNADHDDFVRRLIAYLISLRDEIDESLAHAIVTQTFEDVLSHRAHRDLWDGRKSVFVFFGLALRRTLLAMPEKPKPGTCSSLQH